MVEGFASVELLRAAHAQRAPSGKSTRENASQSATAYESVGSRRREHRTVDRRDQSAFVRVRVRISFRVVTGCNRPLYVRFDRLPSRVLASLSIEKHTTTVHWYQDDDKRGSREVSTPEAGVAAGGAIDASLNPDSGAYMSVGIRHEYKRKTVHREKMTPRRHVFAAIRRALVVAGIVTLLVLALSSQDAGNTVHQSLLLEEDSNLTPEEKLMEEATNAETERRLDARRKFLAEKCAEEELDRPGNDSLHRPNAWEFLVNKEYHLIWCNVFKAASTSWMYNFNLLAGYSPQFLRASKAVPVSLARQRYPRHTAEELSKFLNDSISFLIVRHPFERLLSAYRDKLEHSLPHTFHSNLGAHIVWHYRSRDPKTNGRHGPRYPLFEEFVRWLLCQWRAGNELDMHWTPVVNFCTPCQVRFDVIAKFETLHEDQDYLIKQAHVGHIIKPEWKNPTRGVQTKDVIKNYFAQLSKSQIKDLYEMFRYDFVLFDYSPADYIALGRDEDTELICKK